MNSLILVMLQKILKYFVQYFPIALTKNEYYDRLTKQILTKVCNENSVCVDVGCNEGKILKLMQHIAPKAKHWVFEPIPFLFEQLQLKFSNKVHLFQLALSNIKGKSLFNYVLTNSAYSGFKKRAYDKIETDTAIEVQTDLLDNIIPPKTKIALIKIDVEGAELLVLQGALQTIQHSKSIILFEFGKGAADIYENSSETMFQFFNTHLQYEIFTLNDWLKHRTSLTFSQFNNYFEQNNEYFFLAAPKQ